MWIASTAGWFSIVQDRTQRGYVLVRARSWEHLSNLLRIFPEGRGHELATPENDYPWRLVLPRRKLRVLFERLEGEIDYGNFKAEVHRTGDGAAADCYHEVWGVVRRHLDERLRHPAEPLQHRLPGGDGDDPEPGAAL